MNRAQGKVKVKFSVDLSALRSDARVKIVYYAAFVCLESTVQNARKETSIGIASLEPESKNRVPDGAVLPQEHRLGHE